MATKFNRADLMRSSIKEEEKAVKERFATADAVMERRPGGLAQPREPIGEQRLEAAADTFSAESVGQRLGYKTERNNEEDRILVVEISKVHDNPYNARAIYSPQEIKERAASIAADGQKTPATAMVHPDRPGEYILLDGHYRKKSLLHLGRSEIRITLDRSKDKFEMYRVSRILNVQRQDQTALDDAIVWSKMKAEGLFTNDDDIAQKLGISVGSVSKTMSMIKLDKDVLEEVKKQPGKFGVAMGYEVYLCSKVMGKDDLLKLVQDIMENDLPTREVQSIRERIEKNKPRKPKEVNTIYKLKSGDQQIGSFKVSEEGKVALVVMIDDPTERAELIGEIKRRFGL